MNFGAEKSVRGFERFGKDRWESLFLPACAQAGFWAAAVFGLCAPVGAQPLERQTDVKYFSGGAQFPGRMQSSSAASVVPSSAVLHSQKLESASESNARRAYQLNEEGVELVFQGSRKQGRQKIQQALNYDPKNPTCLYNLAGLELADSNPKKAIALMQRAIELRPQDPAFLNRLAEAHFADSDVKAAISSYEQIVQLDPAYGDSLLRLGTLYGMVKDWDKSELTLRRAAELHPKDLRTLSNLGSVLVLREKFPEAIFILERAQAIKTTPENSVALGIAYEAVGDQARALKSYQSAKGLGDKDVELSNHIAELSTHIAPTVADRKPK